LASDEFTDVLKRHGIAISVGGRGQRHGDAFVERSCARR